MCDWYRAIGVKKKTETKTKKHRNLRQREKINKLFTGF